MKRSSLILGVVLLLAVLLRTIELNKFPYGFHFDEAKLAWNAVSILNTGRDDNGNRLPLYYNSFGDFRPTGIFYSIVPLLWILGRSVLAVRILPALVGALTIIPIYFLTNSLMNNKKLENVGLWAGFFLAVNPWHISVSRASSEVIMAMFMSLWGMYFFGKGDKR